MARYEELLLFPQCFQKACFPGVSKGIIVWEWVKPELSLKRMNTPKQLLSKKLCQEYDMHIYACL